MLSKAPIHHFGGNNVSLERTPCRMDHRRIGPVSLPNLLPRSKFLLSENKTFLQSTQRKSLA